jgi:hypothetical protein
MNKKIKNTKFWSIYESVRQVLNIWVGRLIVKQKYYARSSATDLLMREVVRNEPWIDDEWQPPGRAGPKWAQNT